MLAILAILAALLIPALTGYIDKAKNKEIIAKTRQVVMAVQTIVDEQYAKNSDVGKLAKILVNTNNVTKYDSGALIISAEEIASLADFSVVNGSNSLVGATLSKGKVSALTYTSGTKRCVYNGTNYEVIDSTDASTAPTAESTSATAS